MRTWMHSVMGSLRLTLRSSSTSLQNATLVSKTWKRREMLRLLPHCPAAPLSCMSSRLSYGRHSRSRVKMLRMCESATEPH